MWPSVFFFAELCARCVLTSHGRQALFSELPDPAAVVEHRQVHPRDDMVQSRLTCSEERFAASSPSALREIESNFQAVIYKINGCSAMFLNSVPVVFA
jgi:hypothetical protein